jgi:hypothetical protein
MRNRGEEMYDGKRVCVISANECRIEKNPGDKMNSCII